MIRAPAKPKRIAIIATGLAGLAVTGIGAWLSQGFGHSSWLRFGPHRPAVWLRKPRIIQLSNTFTRLAKKAELSVVQIEAISPAMASPDPHQPWKRRRERSLGSGVILSRRGYILTNRHVVTGAERLIVRVPEQDSAYRGHIVGMDRQTDLAVIRIFPHEPLTAAHLGNSRSVEIGDWVLAVGSPFGLNGTVTAGIVSALKRRIDYNHPLQRFIQTDAAINPGNSGGPLLDLAGQVIGINTAIDTNTGSNRGIGFALPSNLARMIYDQLALHGHVSRGAIGIYFQSRLGTAVRRAYHWPGVPIASLAPGGPAARAGLKAGDCILAVNRKPIRNSADLRRAILEQPIGSRPWFVIDRGGHDFQVRVQIANRNRLFGLQRRATLRNPMKPKLGLQVRLAPVTPGAVHQARLAPMRGVWVSRVVAGSFADRLAIHNGDEIVAIDRRPIRGLTGYQRILAQIHRGQVIVFALRRQGPFGDLEPWYVGGYYGH